MSGQEFQIRQYGRQELALRYFPHMSPQSAWRKLQLWMAINPRLALLLTPPQPPLRASRTFTPRQVRIIIEELGEP